MRREPIGQVPGWAHHPHDYAFVQGLRADMVPAWERQLARRYSGLYKRQGRRAANLAMLPVRALCQQVRQTLGHGLNLATDDQAIRDQADTQARRCAAMAEPRAYVEGLGLAPADAETEAGERARYACAKWWRRRLRSLYGSTLEGAAIEARIVHKRAEPYASEAACERRRGQRARNRAILTELLAINEREQECSLQALADLSVSNPQVRRAELMTRIRGFGEYAQAHGDAAMFYTITCPSRMHATKRDGRANDRYDGTRPDAAQRYLARQWAKARAELARREIGVYGFRVAEPNHDGTPHWHVLLWCHPNQRGALSAVLRAYALQVDGTEPGARKHRFTAVAIDPEKGSAAGYIAKYIAKNIDGKRADGTSAGDDLTAPGTLASAAARIDAWASTWRIRQFQQIGGPSVTVWRELRRLEACDVPAIERARFVADLGDWAGFIAAMGGPYAGRDAPVRAWTVGALETETGELRINAYGEPAAARVVGVQAAGAQVRTRVHEWRIERRPEPVLPLGELAACEVEVRTLDEWESFSASGAAAAPWTRVNNCTGVVEHERESAADGGAIPAEWAEWAGFAGGGARVAPPN